MGRRYPHHRPVGGGRCCGRSEDSCERRGMEFRGWPPEALDWFDGLAADNSKAWFHANRPVYDEAVRSPMEDLVDDLTPEFGEMRVSRPNRDIRFSKDKTPYKLEIYARTRRPDGIGPLRAPQPRGTLRRGGAVHAGPRPAGARPGRDRRRHVRGRARGDPRRTERRRLRAVDRRRAEDRAPRLPRRPSPNRSAAAPAPGRGDRVPSPEVVAHTRRRGAHRGGTARPGPTARLAGRPA